MSGLIYELIDIINIEADLYEDLLTLCFKKNQVIIKSDLEGLSNANKAEQELIARVQSVEKKRSVLVDDIAFVINHTDSSLTISDLCNILKNDQFEEYSLLSDAASRIRNILEKIKEINTQNAQLLNESIEYINFTINAISSSFEAPRASYDYGADAGSGNMSFFDRKQ